MMSEYTEYTQQDAAWQANSYYDFARNSAVKEDWVGWWNWMTYFDSCVEDYADAPEDLGVEHLTQGHEPGTLYDCPACESYCYCDPFFVCIACADKCHCDESMPLVCHFCS